MQAVYQCSLCWAPQQDGCVLDVHPKDLLDSLDAVHHNHLAVVLNTELYWYARGLVASTSGDLRLLTVHSGTALASSVVYRVQLGSSDVIHSFALPALGIKADVLPGRINSVIMNCLTSGLLLGQCSELCGSFHGFMPLTLILAA